MLKILERLQDTNTPYFGQQRAYDSKSNQSDIADLTGEAPAIYGFPLNDLTNNKNESALHLVVSRLKDLFCRGVIIEFDWHTKHPASNSYYSSELNPSLGIRSVLPGGESHEAFMSDLNFITKFFLLLKAADVEALFRPFHEMNGDWFWWGQGRKNSKNKPEDYISLFNFVVDHLKEAGVNNIAYVFAPNKRGKNASLTYVDYVSLYPGDKVDVIGLDTYSIDPLEDLPNLLFLNNFVAEKGKLLALTEFGCVKGAPSQYRDIYFSAMAKFINNFKFAYVRTWKDGDYFIPKYKGAEQSDFLNNFIPKVKLLQNYDQTWLITPTPTKPKSEPSLELIISINGENSKIKIKRGDEIKVSIA